jgi:transcription termination factor NusB
MTRKQARELLMQLLYQMELLNDHSEETKNAYLDKNFSEKGHKDYAKQLMELVLKVIFQTVIR